MAKYSTDISLNGAYCVDEEAIKELWSAAREFLGREPELDVSLADDINLASTDPKDLFSDILIRSKSIRHVTITGYGNQRNVRIRLRGEDFFSPVSISLSGAKDATMQVRSSLLEIMNARSMPYSWVTSKWKFITATVLGVISLAAIFIIAPRIPGPAVNQILVGAVAGGAVGFFGTGLVAYILQKMYPAFTFRIGKSAEKLESAERLRHVVLVVLILGIAVAIVGGIIVEFIKPMT